MALRNIDRNSPLPASLLQRFTAARRAEGEGKRTSASEASSAPASPGADRLDLSADARRLERLQLDLEEARQAYDALPEERAERVAAARAKLSSGLYGDDGVRRDTAARLGSVIRKLEELLD